MVPVTKDYQFIFIEFLGRDMRYLIKNTLYTTNKKKKMLPTQEIDGSELGN